MAKPLILEFDDKNLVPLLFGEYNIHLAHLEKKLAITISDRGNRLEISGNDQNVEKARQVLGALWERLRKKQDVGVAEIDAALRFISNGSGHNHAAKTEDESPHLRTRKKTIAPRSPNQAAYLAMIRERPMVFGLGPAGTGKTYLAVAAGVSMYLNGEVERLVFCRPAVEAGERLGFLPGDMKDKVDPYLRPIYDALQDMMPWDVMVKRMETGEIEIAPLAFMRGRTLAHSFVILDEAQNTTAAQMKMFLTRMGEASHMVITGDLTQSDLPPGIPSGLKDAVETLQGIDDIGFSHFTHDDIIRHPLVGKIVQAYDRKNKT